MSSTNIGSVPNKMLVLGNGQIKRSGTGGSLIVRVIISVGRWWIGNGRKLIVRLRVGGFVRELRRLKGLTCI